jgi:hypothetical protein
MIILLSALAVAFAGFCIWLAVRFINRRERWARRLLVGIMAVAPVLYSLSLGTAVYLVTRGLVSHEISQSLTTIYFIFPSNGLQKMALRRSGIPSCGMRICGASDSGCAGRARLALQVFTEADRRGNGE